MTRRRRFRFAVSVSILGLFCCFAQAAQTRPIIPPPMAPVLQVQGAEHPVRLQSLAVKADIRGGLAEISLDMIFFNPNSRILEGELHFPLLPGQEISGLALDIGGEMRQGVPVPKTRGQEIFEEVARRNVDPALLEATAGNAYKLRVYPIPARGTRRVMVRVLQPLDERDGMLTLNLPLAFADHLDRFEVEAVVATVEEPTVESGSLGLVLRREGLLYRGKAEKTDLSPEGLLTIGLPAPTTPDKGLDAVRWRDRVYFTATAAIDARREKRDVPTLTTLVWDASASGEKRDHAREYDLLDSYFAAFGDGEVRLVVVRNSAGEAQEFAVRGGDWRDIKSTLHSLDYDGGSDLAAWKPTDDCREYLLFTDGLANFGASLGRNILPAMRPDQRLYAITSSVEADHTLLRHASQGRLIDLLRHDAVSAARLLLEDITSVLLQPEDLAGRGEVLLDSLVVPAEKDGNRLHYRLAGWIKAGSNAPTTLSIRLKHPDGQDESQSLALPAGTDVAVHAGDDAPLAARLWGRYAIDAMEANPNRHKAAIARLGQELGIVSRETSLIVLETAADYVRYDVTPPASLKAEVEALRRQGAGPEKRAVSMPMADLERRWKEKVAWWERDFGKAKEKSPRLTRPSAADGEASRERRQTEPAPALGRPALTASLAPAEAMDFMRTESDGYMALPPAETELETASPPEAKTGAAIGIALQAWRSDAPYVERMNRAKKEDMYAIYLDERPGYRRSGAFYLDMADRFFAAGMADIGLRVLSNLAEIEVENRQLLRMLAYRLLEAREPGLALGILEKVRELAPHEPQSLRDPAGAHAALGEHQQAADLLYEVATRSWDDRFGDVNVIALTELNALIATKGKAVDASAYDRRLLKNLPSDLRVVLTWDADNTDMDLWVTDPAGEKCDYSNRLTRQGGALSRDCVSGYGPEEFMLKKARPGVYRVEVDYYGSSQQTLLGDVTLSITLTTGFGTDRQKDQIVTMRLKERKNHILVGEFTVE